MPAHSRSENGVASLAYVAGINVLNVANESRGWPERACTRAGETPDPCVRP